MKLQPPVPENADQTLLVYPYLHIASVGFMLITLGVYSMLPELREVHGILVMCLVSSLTVLHSGLCIVSVFGKTMPDVPCIVNGNVLSILFSIVNF